MKRLLALLWSLGILATAAEDARQLPLTFAGKGQLVRVAGVETTLSAVEKAPVVLSFNKSGVERRLVAVEMPLDAKTNEFHALEARVSLEAAEGQTCYGIVMLEEEGGGFWVRQSMKLEVAADQYLYLSLRPGAMRQLAYSKDDNGKLDWENVRRIRLGVVVEGAGAGKVSFSQITLSNRQYKPEKPVKIDIRTGDHWHGGADSAVRDISYQTVQEDGAKAVKFSFTFPKNRHMYFLPTLALPEMDFASYSGMRLTYKATLPEPLDMLILFGDDRGQYCGKSPAGSAEWKQVDLLFKDYRGAGWTPSVKGKALEPDAIRRMTVGCHGVAGQNSDGKGVIFIRSLELIP